jgi:hypothetical protein
LFIIYSVNSFILANCRKQLIHIAYNPRFIAEYRFVVINPHELNFEKGNEISTHFSRFQGNKHIFFFLCLIASVMLSDEPKKITERDCERLISRTRIRSDVTYIFSFNSRKIPLSYSESCKQRTQNQKLDHGHSEYLNAPICLSVEIKWQKHHFK